MIHFVLQSFVNFFGTTPSFTKSLDLLEIFCYFTETLTIFQYGPTPGELI